MANLDPKKMLPSSKSFLAKTKNSFIVPQSKMIGTKKINVSDVVKSSKNKIILIKFKRIYMKLR